MEVRIRHGNNHRSEAIARFHRAVCDRPFDEGGDDHGMTPEELMLSAVGCCAMQRAAEYLGAHRLPLEGVEIRISATKSGQPKRLAEISVEIDAPGLTARARQGLLKIVDTCLLYRTLADPPVVKVNLATAVARGQWVKYSTPGKAMCG